MNIKGVGLIGIAEAAELPVVGRVIEAVDKEMSQVLLGDSAAGTFIVGHFIVPATWTLCSSKINKVHEWHHIWLIYSIKSGHFQEGQSIAHDIMIWSKTSVFNLLIETCLEKYEHHGKNCDLLNIFPSVWS